MVDERFETSAEHTWGALMLAEYFMKIIPDLNELKVLKMLMYHDIIEIEAGDHRLFREDRSKQKETEEKAFHVLIEKIPKELKTEYEELWNEYELQESREAKFCKAIDHLDPMINELDNKERWSEIKGFKTLIKEKKEPLFIEFPEIFTVYEEIMTFLETNGYFK